MIGRESHKRTLDAALDSNRAELVAIYGRRRVGKTFLVRQHLGQRPMELVTFHCKVSVDVIKALGGPIIWPGDGRC